MHSTLSSQLKKRELIAESIEKSTNNLQKRSIQMHKFRESINKKMEKQVIRSTPKLIRSDVKGELYFSLL